MYEKLEVAKRVPSRPAAAAIFLRGPVDQPPGGLDSLGEAARDAVAELIRRPEFSAEVGKVFCVYPAQGPERIWLVGLGRRPSREDEAMRTGAALLLKQAFAAKVDALRLLIDPPKADDRASEDSAAARERIGRSIGEAMTLANFSYDAFRGAAGARADGEKGGPARLKLSMDRTFAPALERGLTVGRGANVARELAATPPNVANPAYLVKRCRRLAREVGLTCRVIDRDKAASMGMQGLCAVGRAGSTPPALVALEWDPSRREGAKKASGGKKHAGARGSRGSGAGARPRSPLLLVGKAITFDTGGYSLKPASSMLGMKYDKCGATAVIGAMHAIASLRLSTPVVGLIAAAENMVDAEAYRPNDILRMYNGVTVEVTNTDAEGRLVLADALAYGCKTYKPRAVIDLATLTGGVVVALGSYCAGCFCGDPKLRSALFDAGDFCGEKLWHLPLWDEHRQMLKGVHSDIVNSGKERGASPIQGAAFLSYFVGDPTAPPPGTDAASLDDARVEIGGSSDPDPDPDPAQAPDPGPAWAHLDIAGVAEAKSETSLFAQGPTGFGVRLLTRYAETLASG